MGISSDCVLTQATARDAGRPCRGGQKSALRSDAASGGPRHGRASLGRPHGRGRTQRPTNDAETGRECASGARGLCGLRAALVPEGSACRLWRPVSSAQQRTRDELVNRPRDNGHVVGLRAHPGCGQGGRGSLTAAGERDARQRTRHDTVHPTPDDPIGTGAHSAAT